MSELQSKIQARVDAIESRKVDTYAASYFDVPDLKAIVSLLEGNVGDDIIALTAVYDGYRYVAEQYASLGRFSVAAIYRLEALKVGLKLFEVTGEVPEEFEQTYSDTLRDRNFYVDDDCTDVVELVRGKGAIPDEKVDAILQKRISRRRTFKTDPVEMSPEYLAVIDEVEARVAKNRTVFGMGACHQIWNLKREYLAEKGIAWKSPAQLNPFVHFD